MECSENEGDGELPLDGKWHEETKNTKSFFSELGPKHTSCIVTLPFWFLGKALCIT
jgi:hypothetical protein